MEDPLLRRGATESVVCYLENHLPAVCADSEEGAQHSLPPALLPPHHSPHVITQPREGGEVGGAGSGERWKLGEGGSLYADLAREEV